jgi:hypothetical protein
MSISISGSYFQKKLPSRVIFKKSEKSLSTNIGLAMGVVLDNIIFAASYLSSIEIDDSFIR